MDIFDPVTGEILQIFGYDTRTSEVYECTEEKILASIRSHFFCDEIEAIRMLANSDIDNPIRISHEEFWAE